MGGHLATHGLLAGCTACAATVDVQQEARVDHRVGVCGQRDRLGVRAGERVRR
ncbi:hypothetical protein [Goekera deserti]|uniref:Uncharacterized protein n=1 Tax=Goekera deserti TaxID=2497753 RepID=A0A7K3WJ23_9ACTN|nr:hypothetical protein [Goekera deserti]NDI50152.1 hypothetical protein [Goekera deserti]NEL55720.1 hypothetical protein [Goekera deserti]